MVFRKNQLMKEEVEEYISWHEYADVIEMIRQDYDGNVFDEDDFESFVIDTINHYCIDYDETKRIVKNYGYIRAIKDYYYEYDNLEFLKTDADCAITAKLAFHLIRDTFHDIDYKTFDYYVKSVYYKNVCFYDEEIYDYIEKTIDREFDNYFSKNWNNLV